MLIVLYDIDEGLFIESSDIMVKFMKVDDFVVIVCGVGIILVCVDEVYFENIYIYVVFDGDIFYIGIVVLVQCSWDEVCIVVEGYID